MRGRDGAGEGGGENILDSINSPREWLAATHELFDVVDLQRKSVFVRIWQSKKYPIKIREADTCVLVLREAKTFASSFTLKIFAIHF